MVSHRWHHPMILDGCVYAMEGVPAGSWSYTHWPWLSPDDPPLFTCCNGDYSEDLVNPVTLLRKLGVPSRAVYGIEGNTHVPDLKTEATDEDGCRTTWGESICDFFERQLKACDTATAPEMLPHGGHIAGPTAVRLLSVHPAGSIHYTLDGTAPDEWSPRYEKSLLVRPGQTLQALAIRSGLKPSRITMGLFVSGAKKPLITTTQRTIEAELGKPLHMALKADHADGVSWFLGGKTGEQYREFNGQRFNPPRHIPWISMDAKTGILSGAPRTTGRFPVIVSCMTVPTDNSRDPQTGDAILLVVEVKSKQSGI